MLSTHEQSSRDQRNESLLQHAFRRGSERTCLSTVQRYDVTMGGQHHQLIAGGNQRTARTKKANFTEVTFSRAVAAENAHFRHYRGASSA
jgi:hypothetical protein